MAMDLVREFVRDEKGVSAVELAILAPVFLSLLFGVIQCGLLIFTQASLHYTVQKAVRCAALKGMSHCPTPANHYIGLGAPKFITPPQQECGQILTATVTYTLNVIIYKKDLLLSATSCFPNIKSTAS
jgi:Flp pilus assembly pilin Flp